MPVYRLIRALNRALVKLEHCVVIVLTGAIAGILIGQVIMRYFFRAPLFWAEEAAVTGLILLTLFGTSTLVYHRGLISVDFMEGLLPGRGLQAMRVLGHVLVLVTIAIVAVYSYLWILDPYARQGLSSTLGIPLWYLYTAVPAAFTLAAVHETEHLLTAVLGLWRGQELAK